MIRLKIRDKYYKIIDSFLINKSSREVTFNNLKIDFSNGTSFDLPYKYQECQIIEINKTKENILFTGFINGYNLPSMRNKQEFKELELELLSPMAMATNRTVSFVGTYRLKDLIPMIIRPLIEDGFELVEDNYSDHQITANFMLETIENCMNKISNNYDIWWYIDEKKGIHINDIIYQFTNEPKMIYNDETKIKGLFEITPKIDATDYCNVINFKNVRTYQVSADYTTELDEIDFHVVKNQLFDRTIKLVEGDTIDFNFPVVVDFEKDFNNMRDISLTNELARTRGYVLKIDYTYSNGNSGTVGINFTTDEFGNFTGIEFTSNLKWEGNGSETTSTSLWELKKDSFFNNLAVGLKFNGTTAITSIDYISSCCILVDTNYKFIDNKEINKCKGKISKTGQIEKIIDLNEQWKSISELNTIATNYININSSQADEITMSIDNIENEELQLNVGDCIRINKEAFFINNDYIITDIAYNYETNIKKWSLKLRNKNYLDNFIDLFRSQETQEQEDKKINVIIGNYIEDGAVERHEVVK